MDTITERHAGLSIAEPIPHLSERTPINTLSSIAVGLVAALVTVCYYLFSDELSVVALFGVCLVVGFCVSYLIARLSECEVLFSLNVFACTYSINVILAIALSSYYVSEYGRPFLWNNFAPDVATGYLTDYGRRFLAHISDGVNDDLKFHIVGLAIARDWIQGSSSSGELTRFFDYKGYPYLVGGVLYFSNLFGDMSPLAPRILNCMFGGLLSASVFSLAFSIYGIDIGRRAATICAIFPVFNFYSANTFRDILIVFLLIASTLLVFRLARSRGVGHGLQLIIPLAVCGGALFFLRSASLYVLVVAWMLYFAICEKWLWRRAVIVALLVAILVAAILNARDFGNPSGESLMHQAEGWNEARLRGSSKDSLAVKYVYSAPSYLFVPLNALYMVFMPVPPIRQWDFPGIVEGMGALAWYFLVPFWFYGLAKGLKQRDSALIVVTSLALFVVVAYIGGALRHKMQFMAFALIHVSYASYILRRRVVRICLGVALVLSILAGVYLVLKF